MTVDGRLTRCFAAVFPALPSEQIESASVDTVPEWDSLAAVTLLAVIEEEFGVEVTPLDVPDLRSYAAVADFLRERVDG
jgi:acyl carrier protein